MKLERLEVRLRPKNPLEQELIEALEAQDGIYGGKNELMRECLRRGYSALKQKMESLSGTGDEVATLDALAQTFASGEYGYRVVKTYLDARNHTRANLNAPPPSIASAPETSSAPPAPDVPKREFASPEAQQAVLEAVVASTTTAFEQPKQNASATSDSGLAPASGSSDSTIKRKVDWSKMRGLAGSGGDGGES